VNLLLLHPGDVAADGTARVDGTRAARVREVLARSGADRLAAGVVGGRMGTACVLSTSPEVVVALELDREPPPRSPVELLVALPRPKILRRVLQAAASAGVPRVVLLGSWRVEKSYWGSPLLDPAALREQLELGLEQGRDTVAPEVLARRLFKPFVEDELDLLFAGAERLLAHEAAPAPREVEAPREPRAVLAIGPEGGWTPYEAEQLAARGFAPFSLGPRAMRVDVAVPYALGQVELWLRAGAARRP
jgi:16S rRNA (uracil1498-N3)-methyltransferase